MSNQPCPTVINECPCDVSPFKNLSSEAADLPIFFRTVFARVIPPLGTAGGPAPCQTICESSVSQEAADLCANELAFECSTAPWTSPVNGSVSPPPKSSLPVPPPESPVGGQPFKLFFSGAQSCGSTCPDGSVFTYTVPAGIFNALSQAAADKMAFTYACRQAQLHRVCLGALNRLFPSCANQPYLATIMATGRFLAVAPQADTWALTGGQLPPGLTFHGGPIIGGVATIDGTPTQLGTFTFTIQVTAPTGDTMSKQYTISVNGISNGGVLADGQVGTAYSQQLLEVGFVNPVFSLVTGTLPDGLNLGSTGIISGTPTTAQTTTATIQVAEADGTASCQAQVSIKITGGTLNFNLLSWNAPVIIPGTPPGTATGSNVNNHFTGTVDGAPPLPGGPSSQPLVNLLGSLTYTGPAAACNLNLVAGPGHPGGLIGPNQAIITITQDGVIVLAYDFSQAPGNLPFSLIAGVNSVIQVAVKIVGFTGNSSLGQTSAGIMWTGTLTPAS